MEDIIASYADWFWWIVAGIMFVLDALDFLGTILYEVVCSSPCCNNGDCTSSQGNG